MSIKIMTLAWSAALPHAEKIVLLALADNANDEGQCYPSISTLSRKCGMDERSIFRVIARLEAAQHLHRQERPGRSTVYSVHPCLSVTPDRQSGLTHSQGTPDPQSPPPLTHSQGTPDRPSPITVKEPSIEPPSNPQRRARAREGTAVDRVFEHWRAEYQHPRAVLDAKRRRVIAAALKSYDEPTLREAISGYRHSPHHMGENEHRTVYDDIALFLRDAERIERGLRFARGPPPQQKSAVERAREKLLNGGDYDDGGSGEAGMGEVAGVLRRLAAP